MHHKTNSPPIVIRTGRGLTIAGTRITLYAIMDYLKLGWPAKLIRDRLDLSERQMTAAQNYIDSHEAEVEAEYQLVIGQAEKNRQYWQARNKKRFEKTAKLPAKPGLEKAKARLCAVKKELNLE
jgi:uncharacterized protein (DUF433 family)